MKRLHQGHPGRRTPRAACMVGHDASHGSRVLWPGNSGSVQKAFVLRTGRLPEVGVGGLAGGGARCAGAVHRAAGSCHHRQPHHHRRRRYAPFSCPEFSKRVFSISQHSPPPRGPATTGSLITTRVIGALLKWPKPGEVFCQIVQHPAMLHQATATMILALHQPHLYATPRQQRSRSDWDCSSCCVLLQARALATWRTNGRSWRLLLPASWASPRCPM